MGADYETKEKLLVSAKTEFMEKGYAKASLRKICANAGVTTGALYFFFKDKEDLLRSIVEKPFQELMEMMNTHFAKDTLILTYWNVNKENLNILECKGDNEEFVQLLIHNLYANRDAFLLLLTKCQGTVFENCVDKVVDMMEKGYRVMAERMAEQTPGMQVNSYILHWMIHMHIDAFIHLLTHEPDEQMAFQNMCRIMDYLVKGWLQLILIPFGT